MIEDLVGSSDVEQEAFLRLETEKTLAAARRAIRDPKSLEVFKRCVLSDDLLEDVGEDLGVTRQRVQQLRDALLAATRKELRRK
jgi:DNA-directed RNA polymerase sigma subunit (sigma70/sigma32)